MRRMEGKQVIIFIHTTCIMYIIQNNTVRKENPNLTVTFKSNQRKIQRNATRIEDVNGKSLLKTEIL
jgi:hypothetical protein